MVSSPFLTPYVDNLFLGSTSAPPYTRGGGERVAPEHAVANPPHYAVVYNVR